MSEHRKSAQHRLTSDGVASAASTSTNQPNASHSVYSDAAALQDHLMRTLKLGLNTTRAPIPRIQKTKRQPQRRASTLRDAGVSSTSQHRGRRRTLTSQVRQETTLHTPRVESSEPETFRGNGGSADRPVTWTCLSCTFRNHESTSHSAPTPETQRSKVVPSCEACGSRKNHRAMWNPITGIARERLTLAQKRGLVQGPPPRPDGAQWDDAFARSLAREDSCFPCPICQQVRSKRLHADNSRGNLLA
jgi:hypothetical protein